jgi:hypothetical protein
MSVELAAQRTVTWKPGAADLTVVLTVTSPVGEVTTPAITADASTYTATIPTLQPGQYQLRWTVADQSYALTDVLNVWPANPRYLLSMDDARRAATGRTTASADDDFIRLFNASTTVVIEDVAGTVLVKPVTQTTDGGRRAIVLWHKITPSTEISVVANDTTLVEGRDFVVDRAAAIIYAGSKTSRSAFPSGQLNIDITYSTGEAVIPPNIEQAAIEFMKHQWQIGHQAVHAEWSNDPSEDDSLVNTPSGFLIPRRVMQLCRPAHPLPGF